MALRPEEPSDRAKDAEGREIDFNDVFSLRRPKDAKAGLSSGLKSMAKGVVGGLAGLVAAPTIGAHQDGAIGFVKGLATGLIGAVVLPITGVTIGTVQMVRGVVNQPEALMQAHEGKIWDEEKRLWVNKPDGTVVMANMGADAANMFRKARAGGVDYYELLQVPPDSSPEQIKKAYYVLARKLHPDKNPEDASAHEKFQQLGEAYQVLCNPELRERYDQHGAEGLDVNFMDGAEFFNMLFGNDMFEHLIGELVITSAARSGGNINHAELKRAQLIRIEKLAMNLKVTLKRWEEGDEEGFKLAMRKEAEALATVSFGDTMLHTIGMVYDMSANVVLGGFFGGFAAKMKVSGESIKSQFNAASAALKVFQAQQKLDQWQKLQERKAINEALTASMEELSAAIIVADAAAVAAAAAAAAAAEGSAAASGAADTATAAGAAGAIAGAAAAAAPVVGSFDATPSHGIYIIPAAAVTAGSAASTAAGTSGTAGTAAAAQGTSVEAPSASASAPVAADKATPTGGKTSGGVSTSATANGGSAPSAPKGPGGGGDGTASTSGAGAGASAETKGGPQTVRGPSPEELAEKTVLEENAMQMMLEAMWAANVMDIQSTLRKVCEKVLEDETATKHITKQRALGLKELGHIYLDAKAPAGRAAEQEAKNARRQMEEAMMRVVEKRTGAGGAEPEDS